MLSLRLRISFSYLLLTVAALLLLGLYVTTRVGQDLRDAKEADLIAEAEIARNLLAPLQANSAAPAEMDTLVKRMAGGTGTRITVLAADGHVLADSQIEPATLENQATQPEVQRALQDGTGRARRDGEGGSSSSFVALRADVTGREPLIIQVSRPAGSVEMAQRRIRESLVVAVIGVGALALLLGALLSRSILKPLDSIGEAAASMAAGNLSARVSPRPPGEVGELADAFNQMAATVQTEVAATAQERSRLAAALDSSVDGVIAIDREGDVLYANVAAERLFQRRSAAIVGQPFVWTLPNDALLDAVRASRDRGESQTMVIERPGRVFFQVVTTPIKGGGDWAVLVVFHDLTDVKRTEQVRRDFIANVSHELRTPLAAIKSVVETLADGAINEPQIAQDFLSRADSEVDRLVQMVEELLELSRIESGDIPLNFAPTDIQALLEDVVERLRPTAERKHLTLTFEESTPLAKVNIDANRIEHAIVNLVHNAIKFTPEGGRVAVEAGIFGEELTVKVHDTGIGIDAGDLSRIFERFYKTDQSRASVGSGLGLAVVKHTVEAHGGQVKVESTIEQGSTFSITIPTGEAEAAAATAFTAP